MLRLVFGRAAAGAAAAVATGASIASSSDGAHAHARTARLYLESTRATKLASDIGATAKIEDDWLITQIEGDDIVITDAEIKQTAQELAIIAEGGASVESGSDVDSVEAEAIDDGVNAVIDQTNVVPVGRDMVRAGMLLAMRPNIQHDILVALKDDEDLRIALGVDALAQANGPIVLRLQQPPQAPAIQPLVEDVTDGDSKGFLGSLYSDICNGLEAAGEWARNAGHFIGDFLVRMSRWFRGANDAAGGEQLSDGEKAICQAMLFAALVVIVVLAKRAGLLRIAYRR